MAVGSFPGGINTIIPLHDASGNLQIEFSRNPKSCKLNKYTVQQAVSVPRGAYAYFNPNDTIRLKSGSKWAPGTPSPTGYTNLQGFEQKNFVCERYAFVSTLDQLGVDVGSWDVQKMHAKRLALQAMISRTNVVLGVITNTANYAAANVVTATVASGSGFLDGGTTADPRIMNAFQYAMQLIQVATGGRAGVAGAKFGALMSVDTARRLSRSREIREYVMQQINAPSLVTGSDESFMSSTNYMLPDMLYKVDVVVEDTFINTGNDASVLDVNSNVMPNNVIIIYVREGGFNKEYGDQSFSSFTQFVYEDMTTEAMVNTWDRLVALRVTDFFDFKITSPVSVVVITNVFS